MSDGTNTGVATVYVRVTSSNDHTPAFGTPTVNTVTMATGAIYYDVTSLCYVVTAQLTLRFLTTVTTTLYYWYDCNGNIMFRYDYITITYISTVMEKHRVTLYHKQQVYVIEITTSLS